MVLDLPEFVFLFGVDGRRAGWVLLQMSAGLRNQTAEVQSLPCRLSNYVLFALKISVPHKLKLELWMNPDGHYMVMVYHLRLMKFISSTIRMVGELTFATKFSRYCFYILKFKP